MSPGRIHCDDLDPLLARRVVAEAVGGEEPAAFTASASAERAARWRCHACGEIAKSWAAAERHADENHHWNIEFVL
jgi:hypothetical protein